MYRLMPVNKPVYRWMDVLVYTGERIYICVIPEKKLSKGFIPNQSTDLYILTNSCPRGGWNILKIHCNEQVPLSLQSRKSNRVQN